MTFRTRLVLATTLTVALAVLLASGGAWIVARNALLHSTDDTLAQAAQEVLNRPYIDPNDSPGAALQVVDAQGAVIVPSLSGQLPVDSTVKQVALGHAESTYRTIVIGRTAFRELVVPLSAGQQLSNGISDTILNNTGALQMIVPLAGVNHQLHRLEIALLFVAAGGVLIAVVLGLAVTRRAMRPLDQVTDAVEDLAVTTDMSRRLEEGGPDELGRLRRAFNHLFSALERSEDQQRQLVLDASHELRTPLTSLRTNTEVLRRVDELDDETRGQLIDDVLTQLSELTTLVGDLTEMARGEKQVAPPARFRLDELVDEIVTVDSTHARTRNVEITATLDPCFVHARRERLARAIGNLLDNALKWSPEGGTIEVGVHEGVVTVRDHGPGIDPADMDKIFDRFYRSAKARSLPGSGLGLAIVAQVVADEGGTVRADEAPGGGAMLTLNLPTVD